MSTPRPRFKDALLRAARAWGGCAGLLLGGKYPPHDGFDAWVGGVDNERDAHKFLGIVAGADAWEDAEV